MEIDPTKLVTENCVKPSMSTGTKITLIKTPAQYQKEYRQRLKIQKQINNPSLKRKGRGKGKKKKSPKKNEQCQKEHRQHEKNTNISQERSVYMKEYRHKLLRSRFDDLLQTENISKKQKLDNRSEKPREEIVTTDNSKFLDNSQLTIIRSQRSIQNPFDAPIDLSIRSAPMDLSIRSAPIDLSIRSMVAPYEQSPECAIPDFILCQKMYIPGEIKNKK